MTVHLLCSVTVDTPNWQQKERMRLGAEAVSTAATMLRTSMSGSLTACSDSPFELARCRQKWDCTVAGC
jgi:hypothetical protein